MAESEERFSKARLEALSGCVGALVVRHYRARSESAAVRPASFSSTKPC